MNKAIRLVVIIIACYLAVRVLMADASLSDVADEMASSPQVALGALAVAVITAWGLVRVFRSSRGS